MRGRPLASSFVGTLTLTLLILHSDADLDALLDRSPQAFARSTEWHLKGEDQAKQKGKATMFSVFEAARDDVNEWV